MWVVFVVTLGAASMPVGTAIRTQAPTVTAYTCPMHPDVSVPEAGKCPKCGMLLVKSDLNPREYEVEVVSSPRAPQAGERTRLRLIVRHPDTKTVIRDFATIHEKLFHLFVISQDLEYYDHIHPTQEADGAYAIDVTLPRPGYYKLYADFLPIGGTPQVVPRVLVTANYEGDLASASARLVPDKTLTKTVGPMIVTLALPTAGLVAGRDEKLNYHIVDAATGAPVTDIEPYLAAFGHTLVMSEDTLHYVHAHPVEMLPEGSAARGGPDLTFKALLPRPGRYRIWTQLKRAGTVATAQFTVDVASPAETR